MSCIFPVKEFENHVVNSIITSLTGKSKRKHVSAEKLGVYREFERIQIYRHPAYTTLYPDSYL